MSLLTIVQNALNEIGDVEVPTTIIGNLNPTAIQALALTNRSMRELAKRTNWQPVSRTSTFTTVASQDAYDLPSDFKSLVNQTMWNTTNRRRAQGPMTPLDWALLESMQSLNSIALFFRIFRSPTTNAQQIQFFPTPSAGQVITFEYISFSLTQSSTGTLQSDQFLADADLSLLDEDTITLGLKWRFLKSKGFPYAEEFNDYEKSTYYDASATGNAIIDMGSDNLSSQRVLVVPDGGFGA